MTGGTDARDVIVECRGLVVRYGSLVAVDGLDLSVCRGECLGLLGPNGAGKTTTVEVLEGLLRPASGTVRVFGQPWWTSADRKLRESIGAALQETRLPDKLTVAETIRLFRSFYPSGRTVDQVLDLVDLDEKRNARNSTLSGGQRQRLALACALVGTPELLFLDEPTTGLDPAARQSIWRLVEEFKADGGSVLLTTHYMDEAARLADRVAIMHQGRSVAQDTPANLVAGLDSEEVVVRKATLDDVFVKLTGRGLRDEHEA
ncbi:MAG: ABC transporter ATP-binding protein [Deltaproteobacteria bacterium]|nr:ABC transporter ATP-binding protein [Deltaproteobacteria bacterium]